MRPVSETQTISVMTRPAPPRALLPRWTRWKLPGTPSVAEYMSIGETTIRFFSSSPPIRYGWNMAGALPAMPWVRANSSSTRAANSGSRSLRLS